MKDKEDRVLVIAPHPDDESLAAGGFLSSAARSGAAIKVVFLTNGEGNTLGHMRWKKSLFITASAKAEYGEARKAEAGRAMARLGAEAEFWNYSDTGLFEQLAGAANLITSALEKTVAAFGPSTIIYPSSQDAHRDHSAACLMTEFALNRAGNAAMKRMKYINHGADRFGPDFLESSHELSPEQKAEKWALLRTYESQAGLHVRAWRELCGRAERFAERGAKTAPEFRLAYPAPGAVSVTARFEPGRLNTAALYLIGADAYGVKKSFYGKLTSGAGFRLRELGGEGGRADIEIAESASDSGCYRLPPGVFDGCDRVFAKVRRKFSFFDDSGFARIALGARENYGRVALRIRFEARPRSYAGAAGSLIPRLAGKLAGDTVAGVHARASA